MAVKINTPAPVPKGDPNERRNLEHGYCPVWAKAPVRDKLWETFTGLCHTGDKDARRAAYEAICAPLIEQGPASDNVEWAKWWRGTSHGGRRDIQETEQAPYMGTVQVSRVSSGPPGGVLFDSEHGHQHFIQLRINSAYRVRSLSHDWVHQDKELVEVSMTEAQWASMISTLNHGSGTPCTLGHILQQQPPIKPTLADDRTSLFAGELNDTQTRILGRLDELMQGRLTKAQKHELDVIKSHVAGNAKFVAESFDKHMEHRKAKFQAEAEATMNATIARLGREALAQRLTGPAEDITIEGEASPGEQMNWLEDDLAPPDHKKEDDF